MKLFRNLILGFLFVIISSLVWPQTQPNHPPESKQTPEQKISPKEADELFRSVDEIMQFASKDTDLPIEHEVKRQLATREQVETYLKKSLDEDKGAKRLQRTELVAEEIWPPAARFRSTNLLGRVVKRASRRLLRSQDQDGESAGLDRR